MSLMKEFAPDSDGATKTRMIQASSEELAQDLETKRLYQFCGFQQETPAFMMDKCLNERS